MAVFVGLDVGKAEHHCVALTRPASGWSTGHCPTTNRHCGPCSDSWPTHGLPVVVVDQPASIGALPVAVAQAMGLDTAYLPGLAMRRIADLHPGTAKTDARDAYVIADAARTLPHTLRSVDIAGPALADLAVLMGYDDDLRDQVTAGTNRIRNLLLGIHPALERALGTDLAHPAVLALLARYGGPTGLHKAGKTRIDTVLAKKAPRMHARAGRADLDGLGRAERRGRRHRRGRDDPAAASRRPGRTAGPAQGDRRRSREGPR